MQVQAVSKKRTGDQSTAGVDVSQDWLDVHVLPAGTSLRVPNSEVGIRKLKRALLQMNTHLVVIEPTSRWHRPVQRSLHAAGIAVAEINPYRARSYARAEGVLAKNDRLDAMVLAKFGTILDLDTRPPAPESLAELGELVCARTSATTERTSLINQKGAATCSFLVRQLARRITRMSGVIDELEREITARIKSDPALARRHEILTSIPGIGDATAFVLIARLSELGSLSCKSIAKIVGVAPLDWESGKMRGQRHIFGGRHEVRTAAYMAALSAIRFNPPMKAYFERLIDNGKAFKQAMIAVVRKLVILANTLVGENRLWQETAPQQA